MEAKNFELKSGARQDGFIPPNELILQENTPQLNRLISLYEAVKLLDVLFSKQCQRLRALKESEIISEYEFNNHIDYFTNKFNHTHEEMILSMHKKLCTKLEEFDRTIVAHPTYDAYYEVMCKTPESTQRKECEEVTVL